jgi:hypothetical protein
VSALNDDDGRKVPEIDVFAHVNGIGALPLHD